MAILTSGSSIFNNGEWLTPPSSRDAFASKNDAHVASAPADLVALKACALASSIIFLNIDFIIMLTDSQEVA